MIFITGLPRSGTTVLTLFFGLNGRDIGPYDLERWKIKLKAKSGDPAKYGRGTEPYQLRGGLELFSSYHCDKNKLPEVIKWPYVGDGKDGSPFEMLKKYDVEPDTVVIAHRDLEANIRSQLNAKKSRGKLYNGSWTETEEKLKRRAPNRMQSLVDGFPEAIWIEFPKFVKDFEYLWETVGHLLKTDKKEAEVIFKELMRADLVRF